MSFRVAVACEDHTIDQYALRPIVAAALASRGRKSAKVEVISNPRIQGIDNLISLACDILSRWGGISDAVVFVIDRDGSDRAQRSLESSIERCDEDSSRTVIVAAHQELEVWLLWGQRQELRASWDDIRTEPHPKERFLEPLLSKSDLARPDKGRERLVAASLSSGWRSLTAGCPELEVLASELGEL